MHQDDAWEEGRSRLWLYSPYYYCNILIPLLLMAALSQMALPLYYFDVFKPFACFTMVSINDKNSHFYSPPWSVSNKCTLEFLCTYWRSPSCKKLLLLLWWLFQSSCLQTCCLLFVDISVVVVADIAVVVFAVVAFVANIVVDIASYSS